MSFNLVIIANGSSGTMRHINTGRDRTSVLELSSYSMLKEYFVRVRHTDELKYLLSLQTKR